MACKPATPAPIIRTLAGVIVPAAVMSMGNIFGKALAAINTALYPATVPMDDRTSMLCARVILGMSSIENAMTFREFNSRRAWAFERASAIPIRI